MKSRRFSLERIFHLNWFLISIVTLISCMGFVALYTADQGNISTWALPQMMRFLVIFPLMLLIAIVDIRFWYKISYLAYFFIIIALIATDIIGFTAMGANRWLRIGPFSFQPSETAKICVVLVLARYFHNISLANIGKIRYLIIPLLLVVLPVGLVMVQPDLGTSLIVLMVAGIMFFATGVRIWKFVLVIVVGVAAFPIAMNMMHDYQKNRILVFLDPESDPRGNGYNILQSKIAIGSGGLTGKGLLQGTQSQLSFLPEKQTDFIFTTTTEEVGFVGGVIIITLYAIVIAYGMIIASSSRNHFGRMMGIGITGLLFFHVFINIAMVMGLLPVVGVPLPLFSYGGTMMMTALIATGLLLNVDLHKNEVFDNEVK